jgi:predicted alpha/beta-hydrolase family hydrolase
MLFLQGTRDALADPGLLKLVVAKLGDRAILKAFEDADHSFHVPRKSGSNDTEILRALADTVAGWMSTVLGSANAAGGQGGRAA